MKCYYSTLGMIWVLAACVYAQESTPHFELLSKAKPDELTRLEIETIMGADSMKDILADGYLASKYVLNLFDEYAYRYTGGDNYQNDTV